jgi:uncharacterized membrane protein YkvI
MMDRNIPTWKIAATYIGTVIGAGFASGQEILQFFAVFGINGLLGLSVATLLFMVFGYIIMDLGRRLDSRSHIEIIRFSGNNWISTFIDYLIIFFLFGALTTMIAGSGAMLHQQFNISSLLGNALMTIAATITVLTGLNGVVNSISFVVPFLLISATGISMASVLAPPSASEITTIASTAGSLVNNWLLSAILYTSYNILLSVSILAPLGSGAESKKALSRGALIGSIGLGLGATVIYLALTKSMTSVKNLEVPMIFIAGRISYPVQLIYATVLLAEIYTTAVSSLYGFAARITGLRETSAKFLIIGTAALAFIASQLGFSTIIKYLYPLAGYGGIVMLVVLVINKIKVSVIR